MIIGFFLTSYFFLMLVLGVPMAFCIGAVCMLVSLIFGVGSGIHFTQIAEWFITGCTSSNTGLTIVLFMVTGDIMSQGKVTNRIFNLFAYHLGKRRGFLPVLSVVTAMFYGAVSGSSPATVAAVGALCYPMLEEMGYDKMFSAGILVSAGCLGGVIPPSVGLTSITALTGGLDLIALFKVAAVIGVGAGIIICVYSYVHCLLHCSGDQKKINAWVDSLRQEKFSEVFTDSIWAVLTPIIILGSIFSGVADTAQAAALSLIYGILISIFVYHTITLKELPELMMKSLRNACPVLVMVGFSTVFSHAICSIGVTDMLQNFVVHVDLKGQWLMIGVLCFMLVGGTIGAGSSVNLLMPLVYPLMIASGANPFVGCAAMTLMQCLGGLTPPIGMALFTMAGISNLDIKEISKAIVPLLLFMFIWALIVVNIPGVFAGLIGNAYVPIP